jgi:hypothetical protein
MTSSNGRPLLLASRLPLDQISLPAGRPPMMVCRDCGSWQRWKRGLIRAHPLRQDESGSPKCDGSHQPVRIDITADQLRERRSTAAAHARAVSRTSGDEYQQMPPVVPAVHQIARRREAR